ncbi:unnamed protein product [Absidia cylindrospora]
MAAGAFHPHAAGFWHRFTGKALGASMWFWMMYRAKQMVLLFWAYDILGITVTMTKTIEQYTTNSNHSI